jgi:[acyl-carrier-protein] S-malonyltransferase
MPIAFLFPGQGSQVAGMAQDLYEESPVARDLIDRADRELGFPLSAIMFGGSDDAADKLRQTEITQPALYVHSLASATILAQHGIAPDMVAGHSLGEYSALAAADAFDFEAGLRVVRRRGELMAQAGERRPGAMAAIIGAEDAVIEKVCGDVSEEDSVVRPANFNSPGQVVISGDVQAVERAMDALKTAGAKRVVSLPVSGAFHSPLMDYAREGLAKALGDLEIRKPSCPVYLNVTARPTQDPGEIRSRLLDQLLAPVRWAEILTAMHSDGADRFVEVGTGAVLTGLARRTIGRDPQYQTAGTAADIESLTQN